MEVAEGGGEEEIEEDGTEDMGMVTETGNTTEDKGMATEVVVGEEKYWHWI